MCMSIVVSFSKHRCFAGCFWFLSALMLDQYKMTRILDFDVETSRTSSRTWLQDEVQWLDYSYILGLSLSQAKQIATYLNEVVKSM